MPDAALQSRGDLFYPAAAATARELFGALRDFDEVGARLIWIETPPDTPDWEGVRDRLLRAAAAG